MSFVPVVRASNPEVNLSVSGPTRVETAISTLEKARQMATHASFRTTQLHDRREDRVTLDEVVKINIRS